MKDLNSWQDCFEKHLNQNSASDGAHDLGHLRRVWRLAKALADQGDDLLIVLAACYFHDLANYPKNHPNRSRSSIDSAKRAREILMEMNFPEEKIIGVCHCIEAHSFSANIEPQSGEARIVQDADRLESLGAIGLARTFYVAGQMGSMLFCPQDPFAQERALDDKNFAIDHFENKLLRLPATMKTIAGKREAERRAEYLRGYLTRLKEEL